MKYNLEGRPLISANQKRYVELWGDEVWEWACNTFDEHFTIPQLTDCPAIAHYAQKTRTDIVRSIIANVRAQAAEGSEDQPLIRRGNTYFWRGLP